MIFHLKILLIGPCKSGKTILANILSDSTENVSAEYRPTQGVRIVEFETNSPNVKGLNAEIELWDCSGDLQFEPLWPAMFKDAHGVVFVYDPTNPDSASKLDYYFEFFVNQSTNNGILNDKNCLVIEHLKTSDIQSQSVGISNNFSKIFRISVNGEENSQKLHNDFNKYITGLLSGVCDRNEQDELNILSNR